MAISVTNAGPDADTLHVLPTCWYRNTWSWGEDTGRPALAAAQAAPPGAVAVGTDHPFCGPLELLAGAGPDGALPEALFCENETNVARLFGATPDTPYPKDGINDHVVGGAATVNPAKTGTKCAFWYRLTLAGGASAELRLRLRPSGAAAGTAGTAGTALGAAGAPLGAEFGGVMAARLAEADEFYTELTPREATEDEALVMRQAFAGMLWSKQLYYYDVTRWLDGDPGEPPPPEQRLTGRNTRWRSFDAFDIMSMPDKWEYPWFAAWDLSFHCVALAHLDPAFAKYQLILLCREWFQHPNGALPAYEWDFSDVNPPVQAWAALEVFAVDEGRDLDFLSRVFDKLMINFAWWVNLEDAGGRNVFEGGFLGLDNIGPLDRSHLPVGGILEQSDATGWMGAYATALGTMAAVLSQTRQRPASDLVLKFMEHFAAIRDALVSQGLWDETDGMYYDRLVMPSGTQVPIKVRSMVSMIPALAAEVIHEEDVQRALVVDKHFARLLDRERISDPEAMREQGLMVGQAGQQKLLLSLVGLDRLPRLLTRLFDESEFLSPHGLRALSAYHRDHPYQISIEGITASIDYEPAESTTPLFGGNSNWRGPIWFPLNYLVITALERYHQFFGDEFTVEYPTGSGTRLTLDKVAVDLQDRLISIFTRGPGGRRACFGQNDMLQNEPAWRDNLVFGEYFNGDNGAALGASHQTGWTGLIADIIRRRHGQVRSPAEIIRMVEQAARP